MGAALMGRYHGGEGTPRSCVGRRGGLSPAAMRGSVMTGRSYRGVVRGGTVVLLENGAPLSEGTEVLVTPVASAPGTAAAVLAAVEAPPHVPAEWVDELD